uniref:Protein kinase domain-containing protein n=1 Tax=Sexangularia sp. CB-2014 TaxID=1486929 RepID=A0A7S1YI20_9EUKA|mmetsp:Transcript_6223/g.20319  ORF Transcript_6223/g.20319 Transcript_6223/m.20319 type:complete len:434 (+) Transcript_6223:151-1452(+)
MREFLLSNSIPVVAPQWIRQPELLGAGAEAIVVGEADGSTTDTHGWAAKCYGRGCAEQAVLVARELVTAILLLRYAPPSSFLTPLGAELDGVAVALTFPRAHCTLHHWLSHERSTRPPSSPPPPSPVIASIAVPLLHALSCLHYVGIVHRDVTDKNIMIDSTGGIVVIDGGGVLVVQDMQRGDNTNVSSTSPAQARQSSLSTSAGSSASTGGTANAAATSATPVSLPSSISPSLYDARRMEAHSEYVVTRNFRAPEVLLSQGKYTAAIDIWSVGCVLAQVVRVSPEPLFTGSSHLALVSDMFALCGSPTSSALQFIACGPAAQVVSTRLPRHPKPSPLWTELADAFPPVVDALRLDPRERPTAAALLAHPALAPHTVDLQMPPAPLCDAAMADPHRLAPQLVQEARSHQEVAQIVDQLISAVTSAQQSGQAGL